MNLVDVILVILIMVFLIGGIVYFVIGIREDEMPLGFLVLFTCLFFVSMLSLPFIVLDNSNGSTIGTITSVEKNFYGTTALYIKTTETNEEKYCIEFDKELEEKARELIGKKVKIGYGKRVGIYSTGKCSQAPINKIEELKQIEVD